MKLGTENKRTTIIAVVLMGLAALLFARMLTQTVGGSSPAAASAPTVQANTAAPTAAPDRPAGRRPTARRPNEKPRIGVVLQPTLDPRLRLDLLDSSERITYEGTGRNIFRAQAEPQIPQPVAPATIAKQQQQPPPRVVPQGPPPPPPIDIKFFGTASKPGEPRTALLSRGGDIFVAREGEIVARRFKIIRISPTSIEVEDVLYNNRQSIPLTQG